MQGAVRTMQRAGWATLSRTLSTLCEVPASAARWAGPLLPPAALEAFSRPAASAGLPWAAAAAAARQQPVSLSAAATGLAPVAAAEGALRAPPAGGLLRQLEEMWADSVRRKRKRAMNKHKHRKRRKLGRMSSKR